MDNIKKIDIHAHATAFPQWTPKHHINLEPMISAEDLINIYDKVNIEKGVLLPIVSPEAQVLQNMSNENCKMLADKYPDRFIWFCNIDPRSMDNSAKCNLGYLIEYYKTLGAKGVGELTSNLYVDDPKMENLFAACAATRMPVTIHIAPGFNGFYGIVDELGLPRLEKMMKKYPDLIILGHSQPFWTEIGENTEADRCRHPSGKVKNGRIEMLMRECPNLYCDVSAASGSNAFMRDPEYTAKFVEEFSDRILYGCDLCDTVSQHVYEFDAFLDNMVETGMISRENYIKIVRTNAEKLLGL